MHDEHQDIQKILDAAKGGRFTEWMYQRSKAYMQMLVQRPDLVRRANLGLTIKMLVMFAGLGAMVLGSNGWVHLLGIIPVAILSAQGATFQLRCAQAYRSGWWDRGQADSEVHSTTCQDPIAKDSYHRLSIQLDAQAMHHL